MQELWGVYSGALAEMALNPGYYQQLLSRVSEGVQSTSTEEIERDLHRVWFVVKRSSRLRICRTPAFNML